MEPKIGRIYREKKSPNAFLLLDEIQKNKATGAINISFVWLRPGIGRSNVSLSYFQENMELVEGHVE